jgi:hypothetical protein
MNERIQHLANQCFVIDTQGKIYANEHMINKFAQLIVRECVQTAAMFSIENKPFHPDVEPKSMSDSNRIVYHSTCQSVALEIMQHFGDGE